jgi:hypothetical protein
MYICPSVLMMAVWVRADATYLTIPRKPRMGVGLLDDFAAGMAS